MAKTTKGIYYPSDYASVADVPKDMKEMAESIEKVIENEAYNDKQIQEDISELKQKNTEQDKTIQNNTESIEELKKENTELKAENERLNNDINAISVTEQAEGENITLNDTAEARFKKFGIGGNSWQETRSGKNKSKNSELKLGNKINSSQTSNNYIEIDILEVGKTYILSFKSTESKSGLTANVFNADFSQSVGLGIFNISSNLYSLTFTFTQEMLDCLTENQTITLWNSNGRFTTSSEVMLRENTTTEDYEPYGAMPSTEFESDIRNCGDNVNLFDKDNSNIGKALDSSGNLANNDTMTTSDYIEVKPNTNYYLQNVVGGNIGRAAAIYDENKQLVEIKILSNADNGNLAITTSSNEKYIRATCRFANIDVMQVVEGTTPKPYSPYNCGNANVTVCNKNMLNPEKVIADSNNSDTSLTEDGYIKFRTGGLPLILKPVTIKEKTAYTFKLICKSGVTTTNNIFFIAYYTDGTNNILSKNTRDNTNEFKVQFITNKEKTLDKVVSGYTHSQISYIKIDGSMIEEGEIATNYTEHQSQSFTFPLAEGQRLMLNDYLADDGIHHKRKQIVLDGTENLLVNTNYTTEEFLVAQLYLQDVMIATKNLTSNHFKYNFTSSIKNTVRFANKYLLFTLDKSEFASIDEFKAYLAEQYANGTPVAIEYELAEEDIEAYTPEQQAVYDEIKKTAHSYGEQTHIFSTDEISLIFNVEARKDMNTLVTRIERLESEV